MKKHLFKQALSLTASVTMVFTMADFSVLNHRYSANAADIPLTDSDNDGVYEIGTAQDLQTFSSLVSKGSANRNLNVKLTADIVINEKDFSIDSSTKVPLYGGKAIDSTNKPVEWQPIGNPNYRYDGTFDGDGHTVGGIYIDGSNDNDGLFGYCNATIKNLGVINSYIKGSECVGGVCGDGGTIINCYNTGYVSGTGKYVGGVCGNGGTINNCYNSGSVSGTSDDVGGVCGCVSTITSCHNTGSVNGTGSKTGGVCGFVFAERSITDCYNNGFITGKDYVGGVCGYIYNDTTMNNCYNNASVSGRDVVGGVCGYSYYNCTVSSSYNTATVSGRDDIGGVCGYEDQKAAINSCFNTGKIIGTGSYAGGVCGKIYDTSSTASSCYYLTGTAKGAINSGDTDTAKAMTDAQFKSGEVAFLLNNSLSVGAISFYQKIGTDNTPVLNSTNGTVYYGYKDCSSTVKSYSNTALSDTIVPHTYVNGVCTVCGKSEKEPTVALGDIDNNGTINAADASMALTEYAAVSTGQTSSLSDDARTAADVNKDKVINAGDASLILTYYAKLSLTGSASFDNL